MTNNYNSFFILVRSFRGKREKTNLSSLGVVMEWKDIFILAYLAVLSSLSLYGLHRMMLMILFLTSRKKKIEPRGTFEELPVVTVQLPMFNERYVARRLIDAVCRISYPRDKLEIQVLDDSTDDTRMIAGRAVEIKRAEGFDIHYIHRTNRRGFKAGALEEGMRKARGEFLLIFDADFVPNPDILQNTIHHFTDESVALVQTRWEHLNRDYSILTKVQALMLDGHFTIEHLARFRTGRFFNFNGTAGIWRKKAIEEAGGWEHDTVTEDLDLSFRVQMMKKWRLVYLPEIGSPAELPEDMNGFKTQQFRWAKGSIQVARKLLWRVLRAPLPLKVRIEAFFHLTNNFAYVLMVPLALLIMPTILFRDHHGTQEALLVDLPLFMGTTFAIGCFYVTTYRVMHGTFRGSLRRLLLLMAMGIGISLNNARAVLEGLFSSNAEFVRTPKSGVKSAENRRSMLSTVYRSQKSLTVFMELAFGSYFLLTLYVAIAGGHFISIPFLLLFLVGYFYSALSSVFPNIGWKAAMEQVDVESEGLLATSRPRV
jgi:cellulose synthase/poly-beta-1,6-N-acetylglucosamine synthase-like glycosyltransferase